MLKRHDMNAIKIEIHTENGHQHDFVQDDERRLAEIRQQLESTRIFNQRVLIFASEYSVTNLQMSTVEMLRYHLPHDESERIMGEQDDLLEIDEATFHTDYASLTREEKLAGREAEPGLRLTSYIELTLFSGKRIFIRLNAVKKPSSEGRVFFTHLFERPAMVFRLRDKGVGLINPHKISSIKVYPGPGDDVLPRNTLYAHDTADSK